MTLNASENKIGIKFLAFTMQQAIASHIITSVMHYALEEWMLCLEVFAMQS